MMWTGFYLKWINSHDFWLLISCKITSLLANIVAVHFISVINLSLKVVNMQFIYLKASSGDKQLNFNINH